MESKIYNIAEYEKVVKDLLNGNVVGFPTETVYGLAIIYDNKKSFDKLYKIKNRTINKPLSMMVYDKKQIQEVAFTDNIEDIIIENFMPGEITLVLNAKDNLPSHVTFNQTTIGVRIPNFDIALKILKEVGKPLLVTSANISSEEPLIFYKDVKEKFDGKITSLIAMDALNNKPSSVITIKDKKIKILRQGNVTLEQIEKVLEEKYEKNINCM